MTPTEQYRHHLRLVANNNPVAEKPKTVSTYEAYALSPAKTLIFGRKEQMDGTHFYPINPDAAQVTEFASIWYSAELRYLTMAHIQWLQRQQMFVLDILEYDDAIKKYVRPVAPTTDETA